MRSFRATFTLRVTTTDTGPADGVTGFTAATGASHAAHEIKDFTFTSCP